MKDKIQTKVDKLVDYIYTAGEVPSTMASQVLGISLEQIEEWAKPLEDSEIIRIKYSPMQGMILVSRPLSNKELSSRLDEFKAKKEELKKDQQRLENQYVKYEEELPELEYNLGEIEKKYKGKMAEAKSEKSKKVMAKLLADLKTLGSKVQSYRKEIDEIQRDKKDLGKVIDSFKKDVVSMDKRLALGSKSKDLGSFYEFLTKAEKESIETKKKEEKFISQITALSKRVDELLPEVELTHAKLHKTKFPDIFKMFRFKKKKGDWL